MPCAEFTVSLPDDYWLGAVSRNPSIESLRIVSTRKNDICALHIVIRHEEATGSSEQLERFPAVQQVEGLSEDAWMLSVFVEVTTD